MHHMLPGVKARSVLVAGLCLLLSACQTTQAPADNRHRPITDPQAPLPEGTRYVVNTEASEIRIVAYPAGTLARFGHPHVLGGAAATGIVIVAEDWRESAADLVIRVADLELDRPEWRIAEGFEPELPDGAIEATRANLFSEAVLDAERHPLISIHSRGLTGPEFQPDLSVRITLRDQTRELSVPVALERDTDQLRASGRLLLRQSDFGLTPFEAFGGALAVADDLLIRFRIVAEIAD